jgi:hypothetical protein
MRKYIVSMRIPYKISYLILHIIYDGQSVWCSSWTIKRSNVDFVRFTLNISCSHQDITTCNKDFKRFQM